jgi:hypothetical protein
LAAFSVPDFSETAKPAPNRDSARFSTSEYLPESTLRGDVERWHPLEMERHADAPHQLSSTCTKFGHGLVMVLHTAAFKADTLPCFSLTPRMGRVKT